MRKTALTHVVLALATIVSWLLVSISDLDATDYIVRADDKLKIKIFQFPELSGDYTVSTAGTITIPPLGELYVAGSSANDISSQISNRFVSAGFSDKPGATVEVVQSRPIYVLGDVQKPGEYQFRAGLTVLQAVSLAGGMFRFSDPGFMRLERDAITIRGDMRNLVRRYYHLIAERARLNSELALKSDVAFPDEITRKAKDDPALAELLNEERSFLSLNVDALKNQLESLEKTRTLYQREIEAVSRQIIANKFQMQSVERELAEVKALFARGLSPVSRKTGLERTQAQIEMAEQGYQTLILRAMQNITQIDQRIFDLRNERQSKLSKELQRTRLEIDEVAVKLDTSQNLMMEAQFTAPSYVSSAPDLIAGRSLVVVRVEGGSTVTFDAEEGTELHPGDVLKVERSIIPTGIASGGLFGRGVIVPTSNRN